MKNLKVTLAAMMIALFSVLGANKAQAQITSGDVLNAAQGLITVQVGDVNVNAVDVIDVTNVLNNNDVRVLTDFLNNSPIASNNQDFLNNLLRDADIIKNNQIVVGVLSGGQFLIMQQRRR